MIIGKQFSALFQCLDLAKFQLPFFLDYFCTVVSSPKDQFANKIYSNNYLYWIIFDLITGRLLIEKIEKLALASKVNSCSTENSKGRFFLSNRHNEKIC